LRKGEKGLVLFWGLSCPLEYQKCIGSLVKSHFDIVINIKLNKHSVCTIQPETCSQTFQELDKALPKPPEKGFG